MIGSPPITRKHDSLTLLAGGIALLSIILALTIYETLQMRERMFQENDRSLRLLVTALGEYTERTIQGVDTLLHNIEGDLGHIDISTPNGLRKATEMLRQRHTDFPEIASLNILDAKGALLAASIPIPPERPHYGDRDYFKAAKIRPTPARLLAERPIFGRKSQRWAIPLVLPRYDSQGRFIGAIYAGLDIEKLIDYYRNTLPYAGGAVTLYRLDGILLARYPMITKAFDKDYAGIELFTQHVKASPLGDYRAESAIDGILRRISYRTLRQHDLLINVSIDERQLEQAWRNRLWAPALIGGVCLLIIAGLILVTLRQLALQRSLQARMAWQASHDAATALPNRFLFEDRLHKAIQQAERKGHKLALLFIDLDNFKRINDSLGHAIGDEVLRTAAVWLRACVRESDTVARFGGDEFAILLPEVQSTGDPNRIASKILQQFNEPMRFAAREIKVTTSIGIALYPQDGESPAHLMASADAAMYRAKESGRNLACLFDQTLAERIRERMDIEGALQHALGRNEFWLAFQPIACSRSGDIIGAEALLRWHSPTLGAIPPDRFISVAEGCGLIDAIGEWVLTEACREAAHWPTVNGKSLYVAVNLSPRQLTADNLVPHIDAALAESGLPAQRLALEITENLHIAPDSRISRNLDALHQRGIDLAVDDFGTGYSSLSYLSRLPVSTLKIDRAFVSRLAQHPQDLALSRAIVALAHSLHLKTVGEGVETAAQQAILTEMGCDCLQGYLISRPKPALEFAAWLRTLTH